MDMTAPLIDRLTYLVNMLQEEMVENSANFVEREAAMMIRDTVQEAKDTIEVFAQGVH